MKECATFTYQFDSIEQAEKAAEIIKKWAEDTLQTYAWVEQLFPVTGNCLFVGNNAEMSWFDYEEKVSRLASVLHQECSDLVFSGEQSYINMFTGFEVWEAFSCDGENVTYTPIEKCVYCGANTNSENRIEINELFFCDEECAKAHFIDCLMSEDDFEEEELEEKSCEELAEMWQDYE